MFGGGASDPGALYGGLLSPDQNKALAYRGLLAAAGALGQAAMPSRLPVPTGAALGSAAGAMGQAQDTAALNAMRGTLLGLQGRELNAKIGVMGGIGTPPPPPPGGSMPTSGGSTSAGGGLLGSSAPGAKVSNGGIGAGPLYGYLASIGASPNEATLLTSAANSESGFNPDASHDGGIGYGLWGHNGDRLTAMRESAGVGADADVPWQQQAQFALNELRSRPEGAQVNSATTPEQLTNLQMDFERPNRKINNGNYDQRFASTSLYMSNPPGGKPVQVAQADTGTATDAVPDVGYGRAGLLPGAGLLGGGASTGSSPAAAPQGLLPPTGLPPRIGLNGNGPNAQMINLDTGEPLNLTGRPSAAPAQSVQGAPSAPTTAAPQMSGTTAGPDISLPDVNVSASANTMRPGGALSLPILATRQGLLAPPPAAMPAHAAGLLGFPATASASPPEPAPGVAGSPVAAPASGAPAAPAAAPPRGLLAPQATPVAASASPAPATPGAPYAGVAAGRTDPAYIAWAQDQVRRYNILGMTPPPDLVAAATLPYVGPKASAEAAAQAPYKFNRPGSSAPIYGPGGNIIGWNTTPYAPTPTTVFGSGGAGYPAYMQPGVNGAPPTITPIPGAPQTKLSPTQEHFGAKAGEIGAENAPGAAGQGQTQVSIPGTALAPNMMSTVPNYKEPAYTANDIKQNGEEWAKQNAEIAATAGQSQQAIQRLTTIADAFKQIQTGAWQTDKAEFNAAWKSIFGPNAVPPFKGSDPGEIEKALHENYKSTLQQLGAVNKRFTQREFAIVSEKSENPNLQPDANLQMLGEDIGTLRQMGAMANDWANARVAGYKDPEIFQTKWLNANPLSPIVDAVKTEIGPLKGMPGYVAPGASAPSTPLLPRPASSAEARKLPPGTRFQTPDGRILMVPGAQ
jgi:hypothetical protein